MKNNYSLEQLPDIARQLIEEVQGRILLFYGKMGVGKTTLIKELVKQLGSDDRVSSPTFSLVNEYLNREGESIFHFDFYRIKKEEEALDMGVDEYFGSGSWCLIEWPDKIKNLLPLNAVAVHLTENDDNTRKIVIKQPDQNG